jgi:poly-gamma-glutamate synthesis protein (capsule biosynthesis protein)
VAIVRELAARDDIDAVLVVPHGGDEYSHVPATRQRRLAGLVLDAGALAVLGNHPHVVQPWEKRVTPDGRETFVLYSIGNFVSAQEELPRRASLIVQLVLVRGSDGKTTIAGVRYVPMIMQVNPYSIWPTDRSTDVGRAGSAALVAEILDERNVMASGATTVDLGCR